MTRMPPFPPEVRERAVRWDGFAVLSLCGQPAERAEGRSVEAVAFATLEWVDWFNYRRLLAPIGHVPPAEAEARYDAQAAVQALAA